MYKLCFYVPESHLDTVKTAVFAAGAGTIGAYEQCCWQVKGEGQFKPLAGSSPFIGAQGVIETVAEYRVEMVCDNVLINAVVEALKGAHPYDVPAYDVIALSDI